MSEVFYNNELKESYISYLKDKVKSKTSNVVDSAIGVLKRTKNVEEEKGMDLYQMTTHELVEMIVGFHLSKGTSLNYKSMISGYLDWCVDHDYTKVNMLSKEFISAEEFKSYLDTYKRVTYISPEMFDKTIYFLKHDKQILNYDYDGSLFMGIYEGLTFEELAILRLSDIDKRNNLIHIDRGLIKVSRLFIDSLYIASSVDYFETLGRPRQLRWKRDYDSVFAFPKAMTIEDCGRNLQRRFDKLRKYISEYLELDAILSINDIANSGLFNYIESRCKDYEIDFRADLEDPRYRYKYNVEELNAHYHQILAEKCISYEIRHLRTRFEFLV